MKVLVIGGSYFYGRVFVMLAAGEHQVTLVNRGTYSMEEFGVRQVKGERHEENTWAQCGEEYDAIVDFCAYEPGDISFVLEHMAGSTAQYILISTVDVYRRGTGLLTDEDAPFETRRLPGEAGAYIAGKIALEGELCGQCEKRGIRWTSLRPAILYGPYNYAPRESLFIKMAVQEHWLPEITDADGSFQTVYVKDAAKAVLSCLGNPAACGQAFNLCQDGSMDYHSLFQAIRRAAGKELGVREMTAAQAQAMGIALPFPVAAGETERYSNEKGKRLLGLSYLSPEEGMMRTYRAFAGVF